MDHQTGSSCIRLSTNDPRLDADASLWNNVRHSCDDINTHPHRRTSDGCRRSTGPSGPLTSSAAAATRYHQKRRRRRSLAPSLAPSRARAQRVIRRAPVTALAASEDKRSDADVTHSYIHKRQPCTCTATHRYRKPHSTRCEPLSEHRALRLNADNRFATDSAALLPSSAFAIGPPL